MLSCILPVWVAQLRNGARCLLPPFHRSWGIKELGTGIQKTNMQDLQNTRMGDNIFGDEEHQVVARKALPILIEKAKAGETIYYSDLARKLEIEAFGYPMPQMLRSIVTTLSELSEEWQEDLPYLTALVVKSGTGYPGFPSGIPNERFDEEYDQIYSYRKWDAIQKMLLSDESPVDAEETVEEDETAILATSVRRWKRIALAFLIAFLISLGSVFLVWQKSSPEPVVYITRTGKKYHTYDCSFLEQYAKGKFAIYLDNAKKDYDPCRICNPE